MSWGWGGEWREFDLKGKRKEKQLKIFFRFFLLLVGLFQTIWRKEKSTKEMLKIQTVSE